MKLHYPGDHRRFDPDHIYGPDRFGAYYKAQSATFDGTTTTLHFVPVLPKEMADRGL